MSLSSPISITIDGTAHSLSRINGPDNFTAVFLKKALNLEIRLNIRHTYQGKAGPDQMERHNVELIKTTWDGEGNASVHTVYAVMISPRRADPDVTNEVAVGLNTWLSANVAAIGAWES